jgi:hypothetical protein
MEHMEWHRSKEFLWSNRRAAKVRIELAELPGQLVQRRIRQVPDHPQRMIAANPRFKVHITEQ